MARKRGVRPESARLPISDGDWIDVKKQLNAGEQRRVFTRMVKSMTPGDKTMLDPEQVGRAQILEYLLAWSLVGLDDQPIPYAFDQPEAIRAATLDALDLDTYREIREAIDAHEKAGEEERAARKNDQTGAIASAPISLSVAG